MTFTEQDPNGSGKKGARHKKRAVSLWQLPVQILPLPLVSFLGHNPALVSLLNMWDFILISLKRHGKQMSSLWQGRWGSAEAVESRWSKKAWKWKDKIFLSLSASHTGILWAPECDYILHTCKKPRQNLRRKKMPCRKRNVAVKEWRVRQAGKGRKHKQSWKLSVAWDCCTEQSHSCKDTQLTLEAEQPHRTNLSTHLYFCQTTTSVCGLKCHLDNVKDRQVIISGNPELGLIT